MKIIELLNRIEKQEKVPKKIMYNSYILTYDEDTQDYYNEPTCTYSLFENINLKLKDEVGVIIEDKNIVHIEFLNFNEYSNEEKMWCLVNKINEIIDKVNGE